MLQFFGFLFSLRSLQAIDSTVMAFGTLATAMALESPLDFSTSEVMVARSKGSAKGSSQVSGVHLEERIQADSTEEQEKCRIG